MSQKSPVEKCGRRECRAIPPANEQVMEEQLVEERRFSAARHAPCQWGLTTCLVVDILKLA